MFKVWVASYQVGRKVHKVRKNKDGPFLFLKQQGINPTIGSLSMCSQIISHNVKMLNDLGTSQRLQSYYKDHFPSLDIFLFQEPIEFEPSPLLFPYLDHVPSITWDSFKYFKFTLAKDYTFKKEVKLWLKLAQEHL